MASRISSPPHVVLPRFQQAWSADAASIRCAIQRGDRLFGGRQDRWRGSETP